METEIIFVLICSPVLLITITRAGVCGTNRSACSAVCLRQQMETGGLHGSPDTPAAPSGSLWSRQRAEDLLGAAHPTPRQMPSEMTRHQLAGVDAAGQRGKTNPTAAGGYASFWAGSESFLLRLLSDSFLLGLVFT